MSLLFCLSVAVLFLLAMFALPPGPGFFAGMGAIASVWCALITAGVRL